MIFFVANVWEVAEMVKDQLLNIDYQALGAFSSKEMP